MIVGLGFVVMKSRDTLNFVPCFEVICKSFKHDLRFKLCVFFRECNDKFACFYARARSSAFAEILSIFRRKLLPERRIASPVGGIQVFLSCRTCDVVDSSFNIVELAHLNERIPFHVIISFRTFIQLRLRRQSPAGRNARCHKFLVQWVYFALIRRGLGCRIPLVTIAIKKALYWCLFSKKVPVSLWFFLRCCPC